MVRLYLPDGNTGNAVTHSSAVTAMPSSSTRSPYRRSIMMPGSGLSTEGRFDTFGGGGLRCLVIVGSLVRRCSSTDGPLWVQPTLRSPYDIERRLTRRSILDGERRSR